MHQPGRSPWIFGSFAADFGWLYLPGTILLAWVILGGVEALPAAWLFPLLVMVKVLDTGHTYTTVWRTYLHPTERRRISLYTALPLALFAGIAVVAD